MTASSVVDGQTQDRSDVSGAPGPKVRTTWHRMTACQGSKVTPATAPRRSSNDTLEIHLLAPTPGAR